MCSRCTECGSRDGGGHDDSNPKLAPELTLPDLKGRPEVRLRLVPVGAGVAAWIGAILSSLCCLLPLAVILLGLGSGAFMAVTMQLREST